jgi:hypothetical protein
MSAPCTFLVRSRVFSINQRQTWSSRSHCRFRVFLLRCLGPSVRIFCLPERPGPEPEGFTAIRRWLSASARYHRVGVIPSASWRDASPFANSTRVVEQPRNCAPPVALKSGQNVSQPRLRRARNRARADYGACVLECCSPLQLSKAWISKRSTHRLLSFHLPPGTKRRFTPHSTTRSASG